MSETNCAGCGCDAEAREARSIDCQCARLVEEKANYERMQKVMEGAAWALCFGIEGRIPKEQGYAEAFSALYGFLYGPDEAIRILAEGARHVTD